MEGNGEFDIWVLQPLWPPNRSGVESDLRFELYGSNYICYHDCLNCFGLSLNFQRKKEDDELFSTRDVGFAASKYKC